MSEIIDENVCRLCLNDCFPTNNIFHDISTKGSLLYEVVNYVYNLEVSREDGLPPNICKPCLWKLREFEMYKMNVHFVKKELMDRFRKDSVKKKIEDDGLIIARQENGSDLNTETYTVHCNANTREGDTIANDMMDIPSEKLAIKSEVDIDEIAIPAGQVEIEKITEMGATASLEHFNGMEIIPAVIEESESQEEELSAISLDGNAPPDEDKNISQENSGKKEIEADGMFIAGHENGFGLITELAIKSEVDIDEIAIPAGQVEIEKITEMGATASLEHFNGMEFIQAVIGKTEFQEFLEDSRRLECHHCGEKMETKQEIAQHIVEAHNSIFNEVNNGRKHICSICKKRFIRNNELTRHMRIHTGEKPFKCSVCNYSCSQSGRLKVHMRIHTGEKPFHCNICNYSCPRNGDLKVHMRTHTGERPFQCNFCNYSGTQSGDLKVHMRKHTGEKPFQCNFCNYRCSRGTKLRVHMRIHTGERPFQCNVCNYSCNQSGHLIIHMRKHTGEKPFHCNLCTHRCARSQNLKVHMRKHTREKSFQSSI